MRNIFYVYRFLNLNDEIIYVGKTNNINVRILQHFTNGHLSKKCYEQIYKIEYIELNSKIEMDIKELYYINTWKPQFNVKDKQDEELNLSILEIDNWILFESLNYKNSINIGSLIKCKNAELTIENKRLKSEIKNLRNTRKRTFKEFQNCLIDELSERKTISDENKKLTQLIKFYEKKTDYNFVYLYDYINN